MRKVKRAILILSVVGIIGAGAVVSTALAGQDSDPKAASDREKRLAAGERDAKKMLLLMDKDNKRQGIEAGVHELYGGRVR